MESEKNKANQKREINDVRYILANKEDFEEKICPPFKSLGEKVLIEKLLQEATEAEIAFSTPKENEEEFLKYFFGNPIKNKEERREFFETLTAKIEKKGIASTKLKSLDDQEQKEVTSYVASLIRVSPLTQAIQKSWLDQNVFNDQQIYDILARHAYSKNWDLVISLGEKNPAQLKKILGNVPSIASGYLS
ncbi:MAG: hypothetical protein LBI77_00240, partial [Puniceicoccales bacterium]|nr:hypothetical protein [Puniceicoccales bacterium]